MPPLYLTLLPGQIEFLAKLGAEFSGAIGLAQSGSVIHISTGEAIVSIDATGNPIINPEQERLC